MKPASSLANQLHQYKRLVEISRDLASTLDLDNLLARIAQIAVELSSSQAASILLYDEASRQLYFHTTTNMDEPVMRGITVPLEGSIAGWVLKNRETAVVNDVHHDPRFFDVVDKTTRFSTSSIIAIPLITKDSVLGVLEVLNKCSGDFTQEDESILGVLGAQASVAIQNTRLFQQSDLISELVHEIRTPLASVSTAAYLLKRPEISDQQRFNLASTIYNETQRLNELASTFLDLARLESGRTSFHPAPIDMAGLLEECRQLMLGRAEESRLTIRVDITSSLPLVDADRDKIKQVLLNLISNAIKYNLPGGMITIQASCAGPEMVISIRDTGIGVPEEAVGRLFERFYRARGVEKAVPGTGLGLSICKHIVESHRGHIEVESEVGHGSIFTVYLPLKQS